MPPKTPRGISGKELIKALSLLGYEPIRQKGSHVRMRTVEHGEHFVTVPQHNAIPVGTINSILREIAEHFDMPKEELLEKLF